MATVTGLLAACSTEVPATDGELHALAVTYGRSVELTQGPIDRTDALPVESEDGLIGQTNAQTRHGKVRFQRYKTNAERSDAEDQLPAQGTASGNGTYIAYVGCQDILVQFIGYDTARAALRHAIVANQMLSDSFEVDCGAEPVALGDRSASDSGSGTAAPVQPPPLAGSASGPVRDRWYELAETYGLSFDDGHLWCETNTLQELADRYDTYPDADLVAGAAGVDFGEDYFANDPAKDFHVAATRDGCRAALTEQGH